MVTRRGLGLLVGGVVSWLAGRILGVTELYVVAVAASVLVAGSAIALELGDSRVSVRRRLSASRAATGQDLQVAVDLRNDGRLRTGALLLDDTCPHVLRQEPAAGARRPRFLLAPIPAGGTRSVAYTVSPQARGRWTIGPLHLRLRDPFGVVRRTRSYQATSDVIVYPRIDRLPPGPRLGAHAGSGRSTRRRLLGSGDEFHTIRPYRTGDDLRHVHWASTAKQRELMVRQNEQVSVARATVLLDTRAEAHRGTGEGSTFEAGVSAAASVLSYLAQRGYETRLVSTDQAGAERPAEGLDRHLERLAVVEVASGTSLRATMESLRVPYGLLVTVLAPAPDQSATDPEVRALLHTGRRFGARVALLTEGGDPTDLLTLLRASRWRATTLEGGTAAAWERILGESTHRVPA